MRTVRRVRRLSTRRRLAAAGAVVLAIATLAGASIATSPSASRPASDRSAAATTATAGSTLVADHIVDVALLPPAEPGGPPRLLTVGQDGSTPGRVRLAVLDRSGGRWREIAASLDHPRPPGQARSPWLVRYGEGRFVLLALAPSLGETWLRTVTWSDGRLRLGERATIGRQADAAGAADVDGDGSPELVLAEARTLRRGGLCQGSRLVVARLRDLAVIAEHFVANVRLAAGALGELDGSPGDDLVAASYANCPAGPASASRLVLAAVRLRDGRVLDQRALDAADRLTGSSGRPAVVDVDGDGRPEVLVGGETLQVIEPARAWRAAALPELGGVLLGAVARRDGADAAVLDESGVAVGRVRSSTAEAGGGEPAGWTVTSRGRVDRAAADEARVEGAAIDTRSAAIRTGGGAGWLDGPAGCPTLVVTLALARCDAATPVAVGPTWLATRPVARVRGAGDRLLVAHTTVWTSVVTRLVAPAPLAAARPDEQWRHGPSSTFSLVEVPAATLDGAPQRAPAPDAFAAPSPPSVGVEAPPGSRVVASLTATPGGTSGSRTAGLAAVIAAPRRSGSTLSIVKTPPSGELDLPLPRGSERAASSWTAEAVSIGSLGDVSPVARVPVAVDTTAPQVALDDALLRPPWPFTSALTGTTEPGAVVAGGGATTAVREDGRFELAVRLAPWPQRINVTATDAAGNEGRTVADVVGGPDLRRLPWIPILAGVLVAGAALSGLRARGSPDGPQRSGDGPVIEEIVARRLR